MDERCYNCRYFGDPRVMPETDFSKSECRRHAPPFPEVRGSAWCGDWQMSMSWPAERTKWLEIRNLLSQRQQDSASAQQEKT